MSKLFAKRSSTQYVAVHCSATQPSQDIGLNEIRQWHRQRGWVDVGYHFIIRRSGLVETGRPIDAVGAHVEGFNSNSVGVCLVGGIDSKGRAEDNFTPAQYAALAELLRDLRKQYPGAVVQGHRDFPRVKKDCPCFDVRKWIDETGVFTEDMAPVKLDEGDLIIRAVEITNENPTITSLARRFGYSVNDLLKANPLLNPQTLRVGELVRLPE